MHKEQIEVNQRIQPSPIFAVFFFFFSMVLLPANSLMAASVDAQQWEITADKITRYEDPASVIAEGDVLLEKKQLVTQVKEDAEDTRWGELLGESEEVAEKPKETVTKTSVVTSIKADWLAYDVELGKVKARGNLHINLGSDELSAESGSIDLKEATGTFENATIIRQEKSMHLEGRVIRKTGELTYHIEDGWIITCKLKSGQTPPWSFGAADTEITDGGYAFLKHATFRIKDIPVFYSPVMILPAKRTRQTGFLFPSMYLSSRDGFNFETPFFVNLSPNADLTLFPRYFTDRGLMGGAEFRYVLEENSKGVLLAHYLDDDLSDPEAEADYYRDGKFTHSNQERYWVRGKADQNVGEWITRLDVDVVSDLDYLREFNTGSTSISANQTRFLDAFGRGFQEKTDKYRNNTFGFLRAWENGSTLQGEFLAVNDVSNLNYTADDPSRAWQLPSLIYSGLLPISDEGGADFSWDANYVNFWRDEGVDAQRVDLFPVVSTSVPVSPYLETTVKGGVRDTFYVINDNGASEWEETSSENRFLYNLGGEVGTTFMRDFAVSAGDVNSWSHMLRPYVNYEYTEIPDEVKLPQFDSLDTLEDENILFYGLNNFFKVYGERAGREFDRDYAFVKFKQGYDLRSEVSDEPFTPLQMESGFYPVRSFRMKYTNKTDMYGDGLFYHAVETDYFTNRGDVLGVDYRYDSVRDINSISGSIWYHLPYNFAAGYSLERAIKAEVTIEEKIRLIYQPACWSVELSSNYTPDDQIFMVTFRLANIGSPFGLDLPGGN